MTKWPRDNQEDLLAFYGTPGPDVERQLVNVTPPFRIYYEGKPVKSIRFHRKAAPALQAALAEIWAHYGRDQKKIDALGISKYNGTYEPRKVRGSKTKWSNHAYGAAIDLNASDNGLGAGHGNMPQPVIDAFKRQGARWGGDYHGRTDPMHFEFCDAAGYPGPSAKVATLITAPETGDTEFSSQSKIPDGAPTAVVPVDAPPAVQDAQVQASAKKDAETRSSWLRRKWKGVTGWLSGGAGVGVFGYLTDWRVVAVLFGGVVAVAILIVLFMGPGDVRAWVRKQVA
jgi:hypothetical protein